MVIYKYLEDYFKEDPKDEAWCKEHGVVYFKPSLERKIWLKDWLKVTKLPQIECTPDVICYWRDFGVWGMYHPDDNSISVCPFEIEKAPGGLEGVIIHELQHLKHSEANDLPHEEKENYIDGI